MLIIYLYFFSYILKPLWIWVLLFSIIIKVEKIDSSHGFNPRILQVNYYYDRLYALVEIVDHVFCAIAEATLNFSTLVIFIFSFLVLYFYFWFFLLWYLVDNTVPTAWLGVWFWSWENCKVFEETNSFVEISFVAIVTWDSCYRRVQWTR